MSNGDSPQTAQLRYPKFTVQKAPNFVDAPLIQEVNAKSESGSYWIDGDDLHTVWFRFPLPQARINGVTFTSTYSSGAMSYKVQIYTSPTGVGDDITLRKTQTGVNTGQYTNLAAFYPDNIVNSYEDPYERLAWIFMAITPEAGGEGGLGNFDLGWSSIGLECHYHFNGQHQDFFYGSVVAGHSSSGLLSFDTCAGHSLVDIVVPIVVAADDIANAEDISAVAQPGGWAWGPPMTQDTDEIPLDYYFSQYDLHLLRHRTSWHRYYAASPGPVHFYDDPSRDSGVYVPDYSQYVYGTFMAVYSGPENAGYADLVHIDTALGDLDTNANRYSGAHLVVDVQEPGWLYIQHAYVGDFDTNDLTDAPVQYLLYDGGGDPDVGVEKELSFMGTAATTATQTATTHATVLSGTGTTLRQFFVEDPKPTALFT